MKPELIISVQQNYTVNNLGNLYANQGKLAEAEAMYIQALQGTEEALGPKHTSTLDTVNNLGALYKNQGKLAEAEAMCIWALQGLLNGLDATGGNFSIRNQSQPWVVGYPRISAIPKLYRDLDSASNVYIYSAYHTLV